MQPNLRQRGLKVDTFKAMEPHIALCSATAPTADPIPAQMYGNELQHAMHCLGLNTRVHSAKSITLCNLCGSDLSTTGRG